MNQFQITAWNQVDTDSSEILKSRKYKQNCGELIENSQSEDPEAEIINVNLICFKFSSFTEN